MKTAAEKAFNFLHRNNAIIFPLPMAQQEELNASLILLLKEQDRDTRHACAEAVLTLEGCTTASDNAIYGPHGEICKAVSAEEAHFTCMNVQAL